MLVGTIESKWQDTLWETYKIESLTLKNVKKKAASAV